MNRHAPTPRTRIGLAGSLLLAFLALSLPPAALALSADMRFHQFEHKVWSIQDGLPQVTVLSTVQGPEGYIWTGTQAGLSRFDGTRFQVFDPDQYPALPSRLTHALFADSRSRLWVGTLRGAAYWQEGRFHAVSRGSDRTIDVLQFAETGEGTILMATGSGLLRVEGDRIGRREDDPRKPLRAVFHRGQKTLVGGRGFILHHNDGQWLPEPLPAAAEGAVINGFAHYNGQTWAASSRGLLYREQGEWRRFEAAGMSPDRVVETIYRDRADTLWVGTSGLLVRLQGRRVIDRFDGKGLFSDGNVLSITEDHEGNLWLGSRSYGLARLWDGYVLRYARPEGLQEALTWSLAPDDSGAIWVGTADGLARFADGRFENIVDGGQQPHPHAYTLLPERERVWVGTRSGLYWWWREEQRLEQPTALAALRGHQVNAVLHRRDGYWLGSTSGIWHWDGEQLQRRLSADDDSAHQTRILLETRDGRLLAGTLGGILEYHPGEGFRPLPDLGNRHDVMAMLELEDGRLLAGTRDEKLLVRHAGRWQVIGVDDGLPANASFAILNYAGQIWVAGNRGLYRIPLDSFNAYLDGRVETVAAEMILSERGDIPGAQNTPCCNGAGNARSAIVRGAMWFPTRTGIVAVDAERIQRNPHPPRLRIDRVRFDDQWQLLDRAPALHLDSEQRDLDIGFTSLSFQDPSSVQLEYRLRGYEDQWQSLDDPTRRVAYYTNLPPGDLRFQVRGSNNVGLWATEAAELPVHIAPRWYETHLVRGLAIAAGLLLLAAALWLNTRRMAARERELSRLVAERTEALRVANENLQDYSQQLKATSMTDPLTGLWNRRYLNEHIAPELREFERRQNDAGARPRGECMLIALIDLDHFKRVNDQLGHDAGDQVLRQFADALRGLVHPRDHVLRWGGEEFMVVFKALPEDQMTGLARRLIRSLRRHTFTLDNGQAVRLTCSAGLSRFPPAPGPAGEGAWEQAVAFADKALYRVKHSGRDGWCLVEATVPAKQLGDRYEDELETLEAAGLIRVHWARESDE